MPSYNPAEVEPRQQAAWDRTSAFRTVDPSDPSIAGKPKYYILDMFPYPSGAGLHVGHPEGYTATDILARFKRMNGFHVLHPMGWDAFGLPAEEFARKTGTHPRLTTAKSIENFRRQIKSLGFSYDWQREVDTTDPKYVRWTQWIFLLLYDTWYDPVAQKGKAIAELPIPDAIRAAGEGAIRKYQDDRRLAYQAEVLVNWCPELGTVLANEEVVDGVSERGGHPVERRPLRQWLMRITAYAERLLADLEGLDWSESIKSMQRNWIGKSEGAEIDFGIEGSSEKLRVFTTRPDTLFGATYMVLAPELSIVDTIATPEQRAAITAYREETARKSDFERTEGNKKKKTGVFTGAYAINPVNGAKVPIWIADYVLATYGTGAIMSVPGHDERDFEFAKRYELPIVPVVRPESGTVDLTEAFTEAGIAVNSGFLDGLPTLKAKETMIAHLERENLGLRRVNYKLRDWLFSRQRYWGEPFPILHELGPDGKPSGVIKTLDPSELPLTLPEMQDFNPTGSPEGPLAKATDWVEIERDGKRYRRETNTMPQWAGSCWYFLRYIDPTNEEVFADPKKLAHWLPVDLYVGGAEHAVLHLLYSRFWFKVLFDRGYVPCTEPFQKLVNQGMILGEVEYHVPESVYQANEAKIKELGVEGAYVPSDDDKESTYALKLPTPHPEKKVNLPDDWLKKQEGKTYLKDKSTGIVLTGRADKMSKSRGNVVNPDDIIGEYGADSLRLYEMFMGPLEATKPWSTKSVEGVHRFLARVWRLIVDDRAEQLTLAAEVQEIPADAETLRRLHKTIRKITEDTEGLRFNTAIAAMMEFTNFLTQQKVRAKSVLESFILLLAPYAPHIAEELWSALGRTDSLASATWPKFDPALTVDEAIEIPVQVNGKVKTKLQVAAEIADSDLEAAALADEKVREAIGGKPVKLVKVVPKRLVNIVIG